MTAQRRMMPRLRHLYIDGFAGAGVHISRTTGDFVLGSPLNALLVEPPFHEFHLVDLQKGRAAHLRSLIGDRLGEDVFIYEGDCNVILPNQVFPRVRFQDYKRALCILDPYGLDLDWQVMEAAGLLGTIDLFLNFPMMDINRSVLWSDLSRVHSEQAIRLTRFWGDESWRDVAYRTEETLFGPELVKNPGTEVVEAFQQRLKDVAGFENVVKPLPMRNNQGAIVYYLCFASPKPVAVGIVKDIFKKFADRGERNG
ncbi:MAG: three-Cys-motif partner protein TcmP [Fimbriimonadaceae bacterium]|nr:MAG: three-Cys-motif partner protein TcmP [Fimbriimonadaceae bacterium]